VVIIITFDLEGRPLTQGSGFFINDKAEVVTNVHVIKGAYSAKVKLTDGKLYSVQKIMAEDKDADLVRLSTDVPVKNILPVTLSKLIKDGRNRIISYLDKEAVTRGELIGEHTEDDVSAFLENLQGYVDAVGRAAEVGPLDFRATTGYGSERGSQPPS
jgi:hypothetical protein